MGAKETLEKIKQLEKIIDEGFIDEIIDLTIDKLIYYEKSKLEKELDEIRGKMVEFEKKYEMDSSTFDKQFKEGKLGDKEDLFEWNALFEMHSRIKERLRLLTRESNVPD